VGGVGCSEGVRVAWWVWGDRVWVVWCVGGWFGVGGKGWVWGALEWGGAGVGGVCVWCGGFFFLEGGPSLAEIFFGFF
jgi:hypothetical protein